MSKEKEKFAEKVEVEKKEAEETKSTMRSIKRKPDLPKANKKNFDDENARMGVKNELDLLMSEPNEKQSFA